MGVDTGALTVEHALTGSPAGSSVEELGEIAWLRESEAEWRELVETMPQIVWITR